MANVHYFLYVFINVFVPTSGCVIYSVNISVQIFNGLEKLKCE